MAMAGAKSPKPSRELSVWADIRYLQTVADNWAQFLKQFHTESGKAMDKLENKLNRALTGAEFDLKIKTVRLAEIPKLLNSKDGNTWRQLLGTARVRVEEEERREVEKELETILKDVLDKRTRRIGNGLLGLTGGSHRYQKLTIEEFAEATIRSSAAIGAIRVSELVRRWSKGEPARFLRMAVVEGVRVEEEFEVISGMKMQPLPMTKPRLPYHLEFFKDSVASTAMLGTVLLSIECESTPGLFKIEHGREIELEPRKRSTNQDLGDLTPAGVCEALAIGCDSFAGVVIEWEDLIELSSFFGGGISAKFNAYPRGGFTNEREKMVSKEAAQEAMRIYKLIRDGKQCSTEVNMAINRWIRSKKSISEEDQIVDLRIAIEALFLKGRGGGVALSASTYGAFYLGNCGAERRKIAKIIQEAYKAGSSIVHGSKISDVRRKSLPEKIRGAQEICREGILRRIETKEDWTWDEVVFGGVNNKRGSESGGTL